MTAAVRVLVGAGASQLEARAASILAQRARERSALVQLGVEGPGQDAPRIVVGTPDSSTQVAAAVKSGRLHLPRDLGEEGFALQGVDGVTFVAAHSARACIYGVGRLLRASSFHDGEWKIPDLSLTDTPEKPVRAIYFATHFGNWYCHAPLDDIRVYLEDLALWGYNQVVTWFDLHHYADFADGSAGWQRLCRVGEMAREVGMGLAQVAIANESFAGQAPADLRATGRVPGTGYDTDLCPSKPAARRIILDNRAEFLEHSHADMHLDWLCLWPYDQGGCNCEQCAPWPRTFMELCREEAALVSRFAPGTETVVSAWWIGAHVGGEDDALFEFLERGEDWFKTVVVGTAELRRWRRDGRQVPAGYRLLLFPEISMFDSLPWGGRGANPAPRKFAAEMAELGTEIAGAMPYSEGRYEDINKVVWAQLMWNPSRPVEAIVDEYCRFHLGDNVAGDAAALIFDIEAALNVPSSASALHDRAAAMDECMAPWARASWRWQILFSHTAIDSLRTRLKTDGWPEEAKTELRRIHEHLQHQIYLHDPDRSLALWIYQPFDEWVVQDSVAGAPPSAGQQAVGAGA